MVQNYLLLRLFGEENVRADGELNERRICHLSELFCAPQVRYKKWCRDKDTAHFYWLLQNE